MLPAKHLIALALLITLVIATIAAGNSITPPVRAQDSMPWPTEGWDTATPESQGIDSEKLAEVLRYIDDQDLNINSVMVVRNGVTVLDAYMHPFTPDEPHIVHSVTKSFVSALIGIAIEDGYLEGIDQRVVTIFPGKMRAAPDPFKEAMTLEDVLMMATGLECRDSYLYNWQGMRDLWASDDWVEHILALPMSEEPGTQFEFCNSASFLLSAIIQETTGKTALDYAQEKLFGPLGFGAVDWPTNPEGINIGWGELRIAPRDMAKVGYLYLHNGEWDGVQLVPVEWVTVSTTAHIQADTLGEEYGYQWWIESDELYAAEGYAGQFIFVVPHLDLVTVFTSGLDGQEFETPQYLLENVIIPAVVSGDPLPDNPDALAELTTLVESLANPASEPVPSLPEIAESVSGVTYDLDPNDFGWDTFTLTFEEGADVAHIQSEYDDIQYTYPIGLDGVYRTSKISNGVRVSLRGEWITDRFVFYQLTMIDPANWRYMMTFDGDNISISVRESVNSRTWRLNGQRRP